jgi:citrate lyase subunit beta / citryl-CoA lyase
VRKVKPLLFVPAHEERFIRKARELVGVEVVLDLEDGCPAEARALGRENVSRLGCPGDWLRIGPDDPGHDCHLARLLNLGIVIPHARAPWKGWESGLRRMCTIEDAQGLEEVSEITRSAYALILGLGDLAVSLDSDAFETFASQRVVLAAKARGIPAYAPPCLNLGWNELTLSARRAYLLGFDGQAALHPNAVAAITHFGCPTVPELEDARAVVAGGYRMAREGQNLIGPPHYRRAQRILGGETE